MPRFSIHLIVVIALAVVGHIAYGQLENNKFTNYDDPDYITNNPRVTEGPTVDNIRWSLTAVHANNWHPVTWWSLMLDFGIGSDSSEGVSAQRTLQTNRTLHLATACILYLALASLTGSIGASAAIAFVFLIEPINVESVAWASQRKTVLCGWWTSLALWSYAGYAHRPGVGRYLLTFVTFALACGSKSSAVALPFVLLLLDHWPLNRWNASARTRAVLVLEKIPFMLVSIVVSVLTYLAQGTAKATWTDVPLGTRLGNALWSLLAYPLKAIWPMSLSPIYPHPLDHLESWKILAGLLFILAMSAWAARVRADRGWVTTGWLWYLIGLAPMLGLVQVGRQGMADRYAYFPLIGLLLIIAFECRERTRTQPILRVVAIAATILFVLMGTWRTRVQVAYWRDSQTLFERAVALDSNNGLAHYQLGMTYLAQGNQEQAKWELEEAAKTLPNDAPTMVGLATVMINQGRPDDAISLLDKALSIAISGDTLYRRGLAQSLKGNHEAAATDFQNSLTNRPGDSETMQKFGAALVQLGRRDDAKRVLEGAVKSNPNLPEALIALGGLAFDAGELEEAEALYDRAFQLAPNNAVLLDAIGRIWIRKGNFVKAGDYFERAHQAAPNALEPIVDLANVKTAQKDYQQAERLYAQAVEMKKDDWRLRNRRAALLSYLGRAKEALAEYHEALRLDPTQSEINNDLAWHLSTAQDDSVRNGSEAVKLAEQVCQRDGGTNASHLDTLAAAYAEAGRFDDAVMTAKKAFRRATEDSQTELAAHLMERISQYEAKKPHRHRPPLSP